MRIAVIDLGTNTFNLLIKETETGETFYNDKIPVKLGEGGISNNQIAEAPFQRGIDALKAHAQTIKEVGADKVVAFATSAIRTADNGQAFVGEVKKQTNITVNVIDGDQEAYFIYVGVKQCLEMGNTTSLIMDIGGGSTEFIIYNKGNDVLWKRSYMLGVSRLRENFTPNDPIIESDIEKLNTHFEKELVDLAEAIKTHQPEVLIGSSGSFETLADMIQHRIGKPVDIKSIKELDFDITEINKLHKVLLASTLVERLQMDGLIPMRADTIAISSLQIQYILNTFGIEKMKMSAYALKEGVIQTIAETENTWQESYL